MQSIYAAKSFGNSRAVDVQASTEYENGPAAVVTAATVRV